MLLKVSRVKLVSAVTLLAGGVANLYLPYLDRSEELCLFVEFDGIGLESCVRFL